MNDLLRGIIADRRLRRVEGDHPHTREVLEVELAAMSPAETDDHAVGWSGPGWIVRPEWTPVTRRRLEVLAAGFRPSRTDGAVVIARKEVFAQGGDPVDLFLAAMAWGFGTTGYGGWRTAAMINPEGRDEEHRVVAAVAAYREAWASKDRAEALARAWTRGRGKIAGLGPAFASKVAYFALYDRETGRGPLIADFNTAWAVWALTGIWDSRYNAAEYAAYVKWCEDWATELGCRSDDVERVLFGLGPAVRALHDELKAGDKG